MPRVKKTRIAIIPHFGLEVIIATFFDKKRFEIVPMDMTQKDLTEKYSQEVYGEWCYPLKLMVAAAEKAVYEDNVEKLIGINLKMCRYPFVMGNLKRWIKKDFQYYPFSAITPTISFSSIYNLYKQVSKADKKISFIKFIKTIPLVYKRLKLSEEMQSFYQKNLPLVNNPQEYKRLFLKQQREFIKCDNFKKSYKLFLEFKAATKLRRKYEKAKNRLVVSGDLSIYTIEFPLFDLDVFLAKQRTEMVMNFNLTTAHKLGKFSGYSRLAKQMLAKVFSTDNNLESINKHYLLEIMTLSQLSKDLKEKTDGIIFVKPNMCSPCENLSFVIKENNNFNLPMVEISYDEHSGANGIITRLEAFLNIVNERKVKKVQPSEKINLPTEPLSKAVAS